MVQIAPQAGLNHIAIDIIRPPDACVPTGSGLTIGHGETTKEWVAPVLGVKKNGPPTSPVGQELTYTITVTNTGKVDVQAPTVQDTIPESFQYVKSEPPAQVEGNKLTWTLGAIAPGQDRVINVTFRATRVGPVQNCAIAMTEDGVKVQDCVTTQITQPQLAVTKTGPDTGIVGVPITYTITVTNPGSGPASNVRLEDRFDPGLEHDSKANPVEVQVGTLNAGESKTVPLILIPQQVGRLNNTVTATADGGLTAKAEHPVTIQKAQLAITKTGPALRYVNRNAVWDIKVTNPGEAPLYNVTVRDQMPPELGFVSASDGGQPQPQNNEVLWNLGTMQPRESRALVLTTKCLKMARQAMNVAVATANPVQVATPPPPGSEAGLLKVQAEAPIEIAGLPAFRLEVVDVDDPIEVGANTTYKIDVTNQGSLPGTQVSIIAYVPAEMQVVSANGTGTPKIEPGNFTFPPVPGNYSQKITFPPVDSVQPGQALSYTVVVKALKENDVRFRVELRSLTLGTQPVIEEESTRIYSPIPGGAPPAPRPGSPTTSEPPPASDLTPAGGSTPAPSGPAPGLSGPAPMPIAPGPTRSTVPPQ
jgi:uncharacterized repeat protein (TIGR01451 family)